MEIGDKLNLKPGHFVALDHDYNFTFPCEVIYIHPERRFFRVRFDPPGGVSWNEAFPCEDRPNIIRQTETPYHKGIAVFFRDKELTANENDCDHE